MNGRRIMTAAWTLARQGAERFGDTAGLYFREALRIIWKEEKNIPVYSRGLGVQFWMGFVPLPQKEQRGQMLLPGIQ